jgi:hypothetical protein
MEPWLCRVAMPPVPVAVPGLASSIEGAVAEMRSIDLLAHGDVAGAVRQARRAYGLEPMPGSPEHAIAGYFLGVARFFDDPTPAVPLLQAFLEVIPAEQHDPRHWYALALLAEAYALDGDLGRS